MKIGYDGKRAANNLTGLGNYSRSLIENVAKQFANNEYFVYTPTVKKEVSKLPIFANPNTHLELPIAKRNRIFWRSYGIKKQLINDKIEIFHGLSHEVPFRIEKTKIKSVVTIHDLIFLRKPQYYQWIDRVIYKSKSKYACKHVDRIIAISEQTKQDIVELYKINPAKIDVVYQSCNDSFKSLLPDSEKEKVRAKYQLPTQYLLNLGTIEPRKNLILIIKALPSIDPNYPLVVIGKKTAYINFIQKEILKLGLTNRVIFLNDIPLSDLPAIYQMASVFIFPSYYEGFGIPIIEALYGKVPVVAASGSCLEEAGGPDSMYISPDNSEELAKAVNHILSSEELQVKMRQKGINYVQKFNNEVVGTQLMSCYLKTLDQ